MKDRNQHVVNGCLREEIGMGGVCSFHNWMVGIVQFSDGVRRVDPSEIVFCDEENQMLSEMEKMRKEKEAND